VERALLAGNRPALIEAYLALAARYEAELDTGRARDALRHVLELDPANEQARAALGSVSPAATPPRDYIDLGELILAGAPDEVTRFQVAIGEPTGDEESDFAEILALFRRKVSESLDPKDAASHYDLGLAFKEMGLLDDAIVHLQSALRGGASPLATLEVLGQCFVLKGQLSLAARVFERATRLDGVGDSDLVGVRYGLARCQEDLGQLEEARSNFERVVAVDLSFRDAAARLSALDSR
jgi:tetratricopeptide (TPR) repeat protein